MKEAASFRWRHARLALGAVLVGGPLVALACSSFSTPDASPPCKDCNEAGVPIGDGGPLPLAEAAPPEACKAGANTLAGCLCESVGARAPCFQGDPGAGGCAMAGAQECLSTPDGTKRWSTCVGGTAPKPEVCHNLIDENCDGVPDDGCPCTDSVDLCHASDGGTFNPNAYTTFTVPAKPKAKQPFDIYLLTKDRPLVGPDLQKGVLCAGHGKAKACPSLGKNCTDWKVAFYMGLQEEAGTYTYHFTDPASNPPCDVPNSATKLPVDLTVVVAP